MQAAILNVKLGQLENWVNRRNAVAKQYLVGLESLSELTLPTVSLDVRHAFHLFVVRLSGRDGLREFLAENGIESGIHYPIALPKLPAYDYLRRTEDTPVSCRIDGEVLSLPMGEHLSNEDVARVIDAVTMYFENSSH